ncbi:MAG: glutamate synthase subunit alpha, partial [Gemmatimonadetes bacterium]|nr:glutamate synthase subunit alpha [Gemmatimonadota bacterium]
MPRSLVRPSPEERRADDVQVTHRSFDRSPAPGPQRQGLYHPRHEHDACGVGFIVNIKGHRSHHLVAQGLQILRNLAHRGGRGAEPDTGDGAGLLIQTPDVFFQRVCHDIGMALPAPGHYGVGSVFLPPDPVAAAGARHTLERLIKEEGQEPLGWRPIPTDLTAVGEAARAAAPRGEQVFVGRGPSIGDQQQFERKLYVIRKRIEREMNDPPARRPADPPTYVSSLSSRTLIYKGMLSADQIEAVYPDLTEPDFQSALALVHQRFSTNTFPSWPLAHPYRYIAHNGEINTLRGNLNWMRARESLCRSDILGDDLQKVLPVTGDGQSDSAIFDNVLEFLVMTGRSLPHAVLMMIPEPWSGHESMPPERKAFYEYHSALLEPWDGPASIAFTDGVVIGAVLDRNGLRPSRYYVTTDDLVIMGSEVGVLDIPPETIVTKARLRPGRMLLVDTGQGRIISDDEIKTALAAEKPYEQWLRENRLVVEDLPEPSAIGHQPSALAQHTFGYTQEDLRILLAPMAQNAEEPLGSMGTDTALAVLSDRPRLLYDYFKQLFAQVTNPPLDAIREELVTSLESWIGPEANLLSPEPESCRRIRLKHPVLDDGDFARLASVDTHGLRAATLPACYQLAGGAAGLGQALDALAKCAVRAIDAGYSIIVITDRVVDPPTRRPADPPAFAPIPSLLATAAVHHHLIREGLRARCGLMVESGDAREVHHVSLLIGYGANAVTPWLAIETIRQMTRQQLLGALDQATAVRHYLKALNKGVLKVMSKMGISTLQGYCGAQIFEAIGLGSALINRYFTGTASRIGGIGLDVIAEEIRRRHESGTRNAERGASGPPPGPEESVVGGTTVPRSAFHAPHLPEGGEYQWRRDGEYHLFNPDTVFKLQHATRSGQYSLFREYTRLVDDQNQKRATLRGLMQLRPSPSPVPLDEV